MKKNLVAGLTVLTIIGSGLLVSNVMAQENIERNPMSALVQKIADNFGLNQDDVQAVFDEAHEEQEVQRKVEAQEELDQLVIDGEITEAQKQLIIAKREELQANRGDKTSMQDLNNEERKSAMDAEREALETWAEENGIDAKYLMFGEFGFGKRGGPGEPPRAKNS